MNFCRKYLIKLLPNDREAKLCYIDRALISQRSERPHESPTINVPLNKVSAISYIKAHCHVFNNDEYMKTIRLVIKLTTIQRYTSKQSHDDIQKHPFYSVKFAF